MSEIPTVNRTALFVLYREPFVDWVNETDPLGDMEFTLDQLQNEEPPCFLIPEPVDHRDLEQYITELKPELFERILYSWSPDPSLFPDTMDSETFDRWFDLRYSTVVEDLGEGKIRRE